jgi:hypothetical protein
MLRLFREPRAYDKEKSLSDNFLSMCSLWCKQDSAATVTLKNILQQCHFTADDDVRNGDYEIRARKRKQQLAKLETAKLAIQEWHIERGNFSSRVELVNEFARKIEDHQKNITKDDWSDHKQSRSKGIWTDSRWDKEVKFDTYLPEALKITFQRLQGFETVSSARNVKELRGSL